MSIQLSASEFAAPGNTSSKLPTPLAGTLSGGVYTLFTEEDLFSSAIPASLGTNLSSTPVTLDKNFLGIHTGAGTANRLYSRTARSHDQAPRWNQQNPANGVFIDFGMRDWLLAQKNKSPDTEIVVTVFGTPTWASARPAEGGDPYGVPGAIAEPASMATLAAYCTWLMQNYGKWIDYIEVWNEPKYSVGTSSYFSGTPSKLAEMAKTIYQAVKAVKPSVKVLGVGCTGVLVQTWAPGDLSGLDYTNKFLIASDGATGVGANWIDILSVHTYEHTGINDIYKLRFLKSNLDGIKAGAGIPNMRVWATEFGYITPPFSSYVANPQTLMNLYFRYALLHVPAGIDRAIMYSFTTNLGWGTETFPTRLWDEFSAKLAGATVGPVNLVGGQVFAYINGQATRL